MDEAFEVRKRVSHVVRILQGIVILVNFFRHQDPALRKELLIVMDLQIFKSIRNAVLPEIFTQSTRFDDASIDRLLGFALVKNLAHINRRGIVSDFDIDLLLNESIIGDLVILGLRDAVLDQILLGEQMMDISTIFQHGFNVNLRGQEPLIVRFDLCDEEQIEIGTAGDRGVETLDEIHRPICV